MQDAKNDFLYVWKKVFFMCQINKNKNELIFGIFMFLGENPNFINKKVFII